MAGRIVTVGTFDGVHRGHKAVLATLKGEGDKRELAPLAMTFDRHPLEVVAPERAPRLLMDPDTRDNLIRSEGVEVERLEFTEDLRRMRALDWMLQLRDRYAARAVVLGYDNSFGSDGVGAKADYFRKVGAEAGLEVIVAPEIAGCSSSAIRKALERGATEEATRMLGRQFSIIGEVEHGRELGRTIGVPTANVAVAERQMLPLTGVYAADAMTDRGEFAAVVNIGLAPTVTDASRLVVEAHLLDFEGDLYGKGVEIKFGPRIRAERKFQTLDALRAQIAADIATIRQLLK